MKILHMCLANFFIDNFTYQENLLPKYHKFLGNNVFIIASRQSFDKNGQISYDYLEGEYINEYDIPVVRYDYKRQNRLCKLFRIYTNFFNKLEEIAPDIIFIHGCQFLDIKKVVQYAKKNPNVRIYVDNHADFYNSCKNWMSKNILHKILWRYCAKSIEPYTTKYYGVTQGRCDFLHDVYKIKSNKISYLPLGIDDEVLDNAQKDVYNIKKAFKFFKEDFVIVSIGKLDLNKVEVLNLMQAINDIEDEHIKFVFFGSVSTELKDKFDSLLSEKVLYGGWLKAEETAKVFLSADLLCFPGLHSVYWEQAVACQVPCIFRKIKGFEHLNINNNCLLIDNVSISGLKDCLTTILNNEKELYIELDKNSKNTNVDRFRYSIIAKESIGER